jgi:hypothetical protein
MGCWRSSDPCVGRPVEASRMISSRSRKASHKYMIWCDCRRRSDWVSMFAAVVIRTTENNVMHVQKAVANAENGSRFFTIEKTDAMQSVLAGYAGFFFTIWADTYHLHEIQAHPKR